MSEGMDRLPSPDRAAAFVTGGARRIGRALVEALAARGHPVAIHAHHSVAAAETLAREITDAGGRAIAVAGDLGREADVERLVPMAGSALGPLGVLINNASTFERDSVETATRASWDLHLEANLRAPFVLIQAFARALPASADGVVVNLLDQRVWAPTPDFVSYTVAKLGLWGLTQTLAVALAPRIRVAGIGPGPTLANTRQTPDSFAAQVASVPLQRGPSLGEMQAALRFILDTPSYTGQMLALDGGQHLGWTFPPPGSPPED
jgi:NAD(P)-dependent dehydrogenase (short-subunit alcohol dehydrogenase family)